MIFSKKSYSGLLILALTLNACSSSKSVDESKRTKLKINSEGILEDKSLTTNDKAEKLALAAEQLMTGQSFMYADEVASIALTVDSKNKRAQLIKALVAPAMVSKGILERIKPIANRTEKTAEQYQKDISEVTKYPNSALKAFLFSGSQDIKTEKDAQNFIAQVRDSFRALRVWLKANKDIEMTLHVPGEFAEQAMNTQKEECKVERISKGQYELECDMTHTLELNINRADLEVSQHIAAGLEITATLYNSYNATGAIAVADKYQDQNAPTKVIVDELASVKEFGTLRDGAGLKSVLEMGLDAVSGIRWAQKLQRELCPAGQENITNRKGFVFKYGLCVDQDDRSLDNTKQDSLYKTVGDVLQAAELALRGGNIAVVFHGHRGSAETDLKPAAALINPVQDLRTVMPIRYDRCGVVSQVADNTLGGIFVRGDVNAVLAMDKDECLATPYTKYLRDQIREEHKRTEQKR